MPVESSRPGGPSYRDAKGGAFNFFFHHKIAVHIITDSQPFVGDNGIDLFCRGQGVSVSQETAPKPPVTTTAPMTRGGAGEFPDAS